MLSAADIRVLALCLTLELEENGTWRVRDHPGQILTGPPKEEKKESTSEEKEDEETRKEEGKVEKVGTVDGVTEKMENLKVEQSQVDSSSPSSIDETTTPIASTSSLDPTPSSSSSSPLASETAPVPSTSSAPSTSTNDDESSTPAAEEGSSSHPEKEERPRDETSNDEPAATEEENDDTSSSDGEDSDDSSGSWITPSNIHAHKVKDLGLFSAPSTSTSKTTPAAPVKPKTILKAAVLTGDFAMQNVGLQMGLNVLGSGGKRVKEVRTWVLRCHACFK